MLWSPERSELGVNVATPEALSVTVPPAGVLPSMVKVTVPVGVPLVPATLAVNVTGVFGCDGLADVVSVVELLCLTLWLTVLLVLAAKFVTPLYVAVIACV